MKWFWDSRWEPLSLSFWTLGNNRTKSYYHGPDSHMSSSQTEQEFQNHWVRISENIGVFSSNVPLPSRGYMGNPFFCKEVICKYSEMSVSRSPKTARVLILNYLFGKMVGLTKSTRNAHGIFVMSWESLFGSFIYIPFTRTFPYSKKLKSKWS